MTTNGFAADGPRLVALGDVGVVDDMIHLGDEAMFDEFVVQMWARGASTITALSSNPTETAARYGVEAVRNIGFAPAAVGGREGQRARLAAVLAAAAGDDALEADDPAHAVIAAVRAADGVAVTGGGNMASIWPLHIYERAALAGIALALGKPFVVTGQTIGPELVEEDRELVAALLGSARLVGLRESASFALVEALGVDPALLTATIDDASFVGAPSPEPAPAPGFADTPGQDARGTLVVSLASHTADTDRTAFVEGVARLIDAVAAAGGKAVAAAAPLDIMFLPHFGSLHEGVERGDSVMHRDVIDRLTSAEVRIVTPTDSASAASLARSATVVVTSRYHPAVFAVAGGVPTIGIAVDDYTTVKLTGALGNFGQRGVVSAASVVDGSAVAGALSVVSSAAAIRSHWASAVGPARAASSAWWDRLAAALRS